MASAQRIAEADKDNTVSGKSEEKEKILLAINHPTTVEKLVNLGLLVKTNTNKDRLFGINVINEEANESSAKNAEKILGTAVSMASAADVKLNAITRHDNDVVSGISNVSKELGITDIIIGLEDEKGFSTSFTDNLYNGYLRNKNINVIVYHAVQPVSTIKKYTVLVPANAERDAGFFHAMLRIWNIGRNSGAYMNFYGSGSTLNILKRIIKKANIEAKFHAVTTWQQAQEAAYNIGEDEGLIVMMADRGMYSYFPQMRAVPELLNQKLNGHNYLLIYPFSKTYKTVTEKRAVSNHDDFAEIGKVIGKIFK